MSATASDPARQERGVNVMLGSIIFQVVTMAVFIGLAIKFATRVWRAPSSVDKATESLRTSFRWKGFLFGKSLRTHFNSHY